MLPELLYRDWILNRRMMALSFGIFGAYQIYAVTQVSSSRAFLVFSVIYAAFLATTIFVREDKFGATGWGCTLPVTRRDIVLARFVESWILVLGSLAGVTALAAFLPGSVVSPVELIQPSTLLIAAAWLTVVLALMQPFTIRFGFKGVIIFVVGLQVLGVVLLTTASMLRRNGVGGVGKVFGGFSAIGEGLISLRETLSPTPYNLLVVLVLLLVNWLGFRLAVFLFRRREL